MAGCVLFMFLLSASTISGLFLPLPPLLPGLLTQPSPGGVQDSSIGRSPSAPAPIWTLWDLASSSSSLIGTTRSVEGTNDYQYGFIIGEKGEENYMTHEEKSDGNVVTGTYIYVDPLGSLITVHYVAGPDGYSETRTVEPKFVKV